MKTRNIFMALLMVLMSSITLMAQEEHPQWIKEIIELESLIDKYYEQKNGHKYLIAWKKYERYFMSICRGTQKRM